MQHETFRNTLISILFTMGFFVVISLFITETNENYTVNNYYAENLSSVENAFDSVQTQTENVNEALDQLSSGNLLDIIGGLLQGILGIIKLFKDSFIALGAVFAQAIGIVDLGAATGVWVAIASISVLLMFIFFFIKKVR